MTRKYGCTGVDEQMCKYCDYIYNPEVGDPDHGVTHGTAFEDLPIDWVCPKCKNRKSCFEAVNEDKERHVPHPAFVDEDDDLDPDC